MGFLGFLLNKSLPYAYEDFDLVKNRVCKVLWR